MSRERETDIRFHKQGEAVVEVKTPWCHNELTGREKKEDEAYLLLVQSTHGQGKIHLGAHTFRSSVVVRAYSSKYRGK